MRKETVLEAKWPPLKKSRSSVFCKIFARYAERLRKTKWFFSRLSAHQFLGSVKACLEISAIRNVWAAASHAIVQWKNGVCLIEDSDGSSGPSGELAFPPPVEHGVRNLCTCKRLWTIAVVFYLSFLLFSVVVVGVSCFQLWEMLGQVKNINFGVCKLLTQVVHVTCDTLLAKARSFFDNCTFWDRIRQRECRWRIKLPTNPLDSVFLCTANCAVATGEYKTFTAVLHASLAKKNETATQAKKKKKASACSRDQAPAPRARSRLRQDSDLAGSVDHTHCCTLHVTAQSFVWTRSVWNCWRTIGRGTAMGLNCLGLNCRKDEKNTTSFHQNATKSRHDTFSWGQ